ncbi:sigma-54 dependent transcriptional regulator [Telmatospirillum sp.]|uniref:sigma-54-dependent transcriptional regulator n=1 Tax=Telmatospirillum sp. TaxID=2079197 RepID=UPI00283D7FF1|nr:sigma-54 dependent transcriptional regulator [Telmatospirillum sp.]MDR3435129.1 sigma-54 dependent transcriptional regulator [Telmatospirillum sp.]
MSHTILLVDDEERLSDVLTVALEQLGFRVLSARTGKDALRLLETEQVDLLLTDLRMPGMSGRDLLRESKLRLPNLPVVVMTAYSSVKDAVEVIKEGAFDYVGKPFEIDDLETVLKNALRLSDALADNERLRDELVGRYRFDNLVGASPAFRKVIESITEVCESRANVLISGESGTGKEMVARAIHYNSQRRDHPFVAINCAAIPEALLESELFGHVKGAFTGAVANRIGRFAQADRGTLFLDEIGDMPMAIQAKILRVLQERAFEPVGSARTTTVDVRIIAASNKDLRQEVSRGLFREDLYYRLNVFPISLPPLRERIDDIPTLARFFLDSLNTDMGKRIGGFTPEALTAMSRYSWPGNIRELQNCIERAVIVCKGQQIGDGDLPPYLSDAQPADPGNVRFPIDLDEALAGIERDLIVAALNRAEGFQVGAATLLGINERSLWHRIKKYRIQITKRVSGERIAGDLGTNSFTG